MATRVISTSIKLDGEAEFKKQLSAVNSNLKNLNSDMKLVTEEFKGQANSLEALTAKDKILNEQVEQQKEKVKALERALSETTDAYGENDKRVDKYRQSLNNAKADLIKLERELDQNNGYLDEAKKSADGASKSIDGFGKEVKEAGDKVLGFGDLVKANLTSEAIIGGVKAMGNAIKDAAQAAVELGKESVEAAAEVNAENSQFEQTFGDLGDTAQAAIDRVAESSGILSTRLTGTSSQLYAFARSAGGDTAKSMEIMERALTVAADSAAYYDRSLEDTTETLQSFLKGNFSNDAALGLSATETTRNAAAMELFGQKYKDLSEIQKQETLLKMVEDSNALSGAMGQAAREAEGWENVQGNLDEALRQTKASIGQELLPAVTELTTALTDALSGNMSSEEFGRVVSSVVTDLAEEFADQAPELVDAGVELLQGLLEGLVSGDSPEKIADAMADIVLALIDGGAAMLPDIMKFGLRLIVAFAASLAESWPEVTSKMPELMKELIWTLLQSVPDFLQVGGELISGLYMGIYNGFAEAINIVGELGGKLISKLKDVLGIHSPSREFMSIGEYMMQGLALGMKDSKGEVMETAEDIVNEVKTRFSSLTKGLESVKSISDLQYDIWEMTYGRNATEAEKYDAKLEILNKQEEAQAGIVKTAEEAYKAVAEQYGENSAESYEYQETLLEEQKKYFELLNAIDEVMQAKASLAELDSTMAGTTLNRLSTGAPSTNEAASSQDVYGAVSAGVSAMNQSSGGETPVYVQSVLEIDGREFARTTQAYYREADKSNPEVVSDDL